MSGYRQSPHTLGFYPCDNDSQTAVAIQSDVPGFRNLRQEVAFVMVAHRRDVSCQLTDFLLCYILIDCTETEEIVRTGQ